MNEFIEITKSLMKKIKRLITVDEEILDKFLNEKLSFEELQEKITSKINEMGGFISEIGAKLIIAMELGYDGEIEES